MRTNVCRAIGLLSLGLAQMAFALDRSDVREAVKTRLEQRSAETSPTGRERNLGERLSEKRHKDGSTSAMSAQKIASLDVAIWEPAAGSSAPLVIFSHGFSGCNTQSKFLMEAIAKGGYLVVAPNHKDNKCGRPPVGKPDEKFKDPQAWSDQTYRDRSDDIKALLSGLKAGKYASVIQWSSVTLVGHSLGGYTALGLAGGWTSWKQQGIKAVIALSPVCAPYSYHKTLKAIDLPVMYQGGTRDLGITPGVKEPGGCYDQAGSPAYFVEFQGAGHFAWTDSRSEQHELIEKYSLAFLNQHVRGIDSPLLTQKLPGVSALRRK